MSYGRIYLITNKINNKKYVGQTKQSIEKRFQRHCWKSESKKNMPIVLAIRKYGKHNFLITELCECKSKYDLDSKEIEFSRIYNTIVPNGYNLKVGNGPNTVSEETKKKISLANKGRKASNRHIINQSISHIGNKMSDEIKQKLSKINKGKKASNKCYEKSLERNCKTYVLEKDGKIITVVNMAKFCRENNLTASCMCRISQNDSLTYKGWRVLQVRKSSYLGRRALQKNKIENLKRDLDTNF